MRGKYGDDDHGLKRDLVARLPLLLVGILPAALLAIGLVKFTFNHFFARAPYLLDSGLLSGVVYRSGLQLAPPEIACGYATSFYQIYVSPIISAFSALSYLVPVRRIEWFAFVQAMVYLPLGFVVYALASQLGPFSVRRLAISTAAALVFSFSGIVLWMIGYPHYEAATPALICLVLAAVVTGRTRLTWIMIALAVSVRQDGGFHVALALSPLVYLKRRGTEMVPSQRRLLVTIGVAVSASIVGFACQRLLWPPVDRLTPVYFGTPSYAHVTWILLYERMRDFGSHCQLIYYPFLATLLVAILRRDVSYLFGWAATLPWFLFNFTAFDAAKSAFVAYTAGPFLVAMFWVYIYGAKLAPPHRRFRPGAIEALFTLVCLSSTLGVYRGRPEAARAIVHDTAFLQKLDREAVHGFADALLAHHADLGHIYVDSPVGALVQEGFRVGEHWFFRQGRPDAIAFYAESNEILPELVQADLDHCVQALSTHLYLSSRERVPKAIFGDLEIRRVPAMFVFTRVTRPGVFTSEHEMRILAGFSLQGGLGALPVGHYVWTVQVEGTVRLRIEPDEAPISELQGTGDVILPFDTDGERAIRYRVTSMGPDPLVIKGAKLRRLDSAPAAR